MFSAIAKETITGKPINSQEGQTKYHRDKGVDLANGFIKLKKEIAKSKILKKKQQRKLFGAVNLQLKPLVVGIKAFDANKSIPNSARKQVLQKDTAKIK